MLSPFVCPTPTLDSTSRLLVPSKRPLNDKPYDGNPPPQSLPSFCLQDLSGKNSKFPHGHRPKTVLVALLSTPTHSHSSDMLTDNFSTRLDYKTSRKSEIDPLLPEKLKLNAFREL